MTLDELIDNLSIKILKLLVENKEKYYSRWEICTEFTMNLNMVNKYIEKYERFGLVKTIKDSRGFKFYKINEESGIFKPLKDLIDCNLSFIDTNTSKIIEFFLLNIEEPLNQTELAKKHHNYHASVKKNLELLLNAGLINKLYQLGRISYYYINSDSPLINILKALIEQIIKVREEPVIL